MTYETRDTLRKLLKYVVVIAVSAAIGIFLGHIMGNYEMKFMTQRKYHGDYKGIELYTAGEVDEKNLSDYLYMLECAPDELLSCCDRMYFTGEDLPIPSNDEGVDSALGLTQGRTIYISTEMFGIEVLFHELFHAYDNANGEPSANSEEFFTAYMRERDKIYVAVGYEDMRASEYFAQAGAVYLLAPERMRRDAPLSYAYFNGIFGFFDE